MFNYTGRVILTHKDYKLRIDSEIKRVKKLKFGGQWVLNSNKNQEYDIYSDDTVEKIPGIGDVTKRKMHVNDVYTVKDLIDLTEEMIDNIDNMLKIAVQLFRQAAHEIVDGRPKDKHKRPHKIDYRKADNPYEARYGADWMDELKKSSQMA